jgi:hypothetical protein
MLTLSPFIRAIGVPRVNKLKYIVLFSMLKRLPELPVPMLCDKIELLLRKTSNKTLNTLK